MNLKLNALGITKLKSNEVYSYLYDPKFFLFITVNGQLLLTMLAEDILLETGAELLQANTDGITVRILKTEVDKMKECMVNWEKLTDLQLEEAEYKSMFIRDVNNYLAVTTDDKYKFKGAFEIDKTWHKDHSMRIVPIAVARACIHGIPVEQTIEDHMNVDVYDDIGCKAHGIYDFCSAKRAKGGGKYMTETAIGVIEDLPKTVRYHIANDGVFLRKMLPMHVNKQGLVEKHKEKFPNQTNIFDLIDDVKVEPERISTVEVGNTVTVMNDVSEGPYDVNLDHYVKECNKILDKL